MIVFESLPADIRERLPLAANVLEKDDSVVFAYLFGGFAEDRITPLSDIDIAVYLRGEGSHAERKMRLFDAITDALGTSEIDLVVLNDAQISLVGRIIQGRRILVDKEPFVRHRFESIRLREFFDFRIKEEQMFRRRFADG